MLNSGGKKINILTLVSSLSEKKILNEKKTQPPAPCKLNGWFLKYILSLKFPVPK